MADYEEVGETIIVTNPEDGEQFRVQFAHEEQPLENPSGERPRVKTAKRTIDGMTVELPLGEYEDLRVRVALVRPESYGDYEPVVVGKSADVYRAMRSTAGLAVESVYAVLLNVKSHIIGIHEVSVGGTSAAVISRVNLFQAAIIANATAFILVHNHPSGDPEPSPEDIYMSNSVGEMAAKLGMKMHDSMIIGEGAYVSFADRGLL